MGVGLIAGAFQLFWDQVLEAAVHTGHFFDVSLYGHFVEAVLLLDLEELGCLALQLLQYLEEFVLPRRVELLDDVEEEVVEAVILEEDCGDDSQDVLRIGNQEIILGVIGALSEGTRVVEILHHVSQQHQEHFDVVGEVFHVHCVYELLLEVAVQVVIESRDDVVELVFGIVQVLLQDQSERDEYFQGVRALL